MMRSYGAALILLISVASTLTAASDDDLLTQLAERARANATVTGSFTQQKNIAGLPLPLESAGLFNYSKQEGVVWRTTEPLQSVLNISAAGLRFDNNKAVPGSSVLAETLLGIFTGDLSNLAQYFSTDVSGKPADWKIVLTPQSETVAEQVTQITMTGADFTEHIAIQEASGDSTDITLQVKQEESSDAQLSQ